MLQEVTGMLRRHLGGRLRSVGPVDKAIGTARLVQLRADALWRTIWERVSEGAPGQLPVPPPLLRHRVHGETNRESFLAVSRACAEDIREILRLESVNLTRLGSVLDFGCGCGRVLRHFLVEPRSCELHGTDIDPTAIEWCARFLPGAQFAVNEPLPPTRHPDGAFDLVYAISVFTHLDEPMQLAWLDEFSRILKPRGWLLLTVHGRPTMGVLSPEERSAVEARGILFKTGRTGRLKLDGLPDFYQGTYQTPEYAQSTWNRRFEIVRYVERGMNGHQDLVLLRNK